jgi:DNA-binding MarR family transcriptional regulator
MVKTSNAEASSRAVSRLPSDEVHEPHEGDQFTLLGRAGLFFQALQRECLEVHGIAFTEYSVLRLLQGAPSRELPPSVLAKKVVCTTGSMTKLVDRLERAGLVERVPDSTDRRGVLVQMTQKGESTASEAARTYQAGRERILARLGQRKAQRLHEGLSDLLEALESDRNQP